MQPVLTHVPPKRPRSTMATRWPALAIRTARNGPDCPVPITIASKLFFMIGDLTDNSRAVFRTARSRLLPQLLGAAHVCISGFIKTQQPVYIAADADANAVADCA